MTESKHGLDCFPVGQALLQETMEDDRMHLCKAGADQAQTSTLLLLSQQTLRGLLGC
jgi:hypothetical protein